MKKKFYTDLTQREFTLLCNFMNARTVDFSNSYWRANFMSGLRDYSNESENHFLKLNIYKLGLFNKLEAHTNVGLIRLLISIDEYWNKDEFDYEILDMQSPESKIDEILLNDNEVDEILLWDSKKMQIEEFLHISMELEYDFIANVIDVDGNSKSISAINEEDLIGFMLQTSKEGRFVRIARNDGFVKYEFVSFLDKVNK